ncbi:hypothetical protein B0H14DRAFT_3860273 [Mycena olivaceomarginata]|nr:hypothetical protein B0H14DRAFT_3860273 [Mycena olivaceomarginata]
MTRFACHPQLATIAQAHSKLTHRQRQSHTIRHTHLTNAPLFSYSLVSPFTSPPRPTPRPIPSSLAYMSITVQIEHPTCPTYVHQGHPPVRSDVSSRPSTAGRSPLVLVPVHHKSPSSTHSKHAPSPIERPRLNLHLCLHLHLLHVLAPMLEAGNNEDATSFAAMGRTSGRPPNVTALQDGRKPHAVYTFPTHEPKFKRRLGRAPAGRLAPNSLFPGTLNTTSVRRRVTRLMADEGDLTIDELEMNTAM